MTEKIPSGSVSVMETGSTEPEEKQAPEVKAEEAKTEEAPNPLEAKISDLQSQLDNAQKLIGKQSGEVKAVREMQKELEALKAAKPAEPQGPSIEEQIDAISEQMENGDLSLRDGNRQIAQLSAQLGKQSAMSEFQKQKQAEDVAKVQKAFLEENSDFTEIRESGALEPYFKKNPLHDDFSAYTAFKADQRIAELQKQMEAEIAKAKEEGAKIAQADKTSKVAGKGGEVRPTGEIKKFTNQRQATDAMQAELARIRGQ